MSKINLAEFMVGEITEATEKSINFKVEKTDLEKEWNSYMLENSKPKKYLQTFINEGRFENEMFLKVLELVNKNVLKKVDVKYIKTEETFNSKKYLKTELVDILDRNITLFDKMVEDEMKVDQKLKKFGISMTKTNNRGLSIYFNDKDSILYEDLIAAEKEVSKINLNVLGCKINYKGYEITGYLDKIAESNDFNNVYRSLSILNRYNEIVNTVKIDNVEIFITDRKDDVSKDIKYDMCIRNILEFIYNNPGEYIKDIKTNINKELTLLFLNLISGLNDFTPYEYLEENTHLFFIETSEGVFMGVIDDFGFKIFYNGDYVEIQK